MARLRTTQTPERLEVIRNLENIASDHFIKMNSLPRDSGEWKEEYMHYANAKYMADQMRQHYDERSKQ